ncbi:hypothetical protein AAMO2058_001374500 [Amorphochlora amoebiformis]
MARAPNIRRSRPQTRVLTLLGYVVDRTYKDTESVPRLAPARGLLLLFLNLTSSFETKKIVNRCLHEYSLETNRPNVKIKKDGIFIIIDIRQRVLHHKYQTIHGENHISTK